MREREAWVGKGAPSRQIERERGRKRGCMCTVCLICCSSCYTEGKMDLRVGRGGSSVKGAGARVVVDSLPKDLQELLRSCLVPLEDAAKMYTK